MDSAIKRLLTMLRPDKKSTGSDYIATVTRVEGNTAYVQMTGADINDTPVALTINASVGDKVRVRVNNGKAWIMGNDDAPPTDNTYARNVNTYLSQQIGYTNGNVSALGKIVQTVQKIAGNTNQYFWHTEEGTDTGAHITEIPQDEFLADPDNGGGNLLARSNGIAVRDGLTELAQFSRDAINMASRNGKMFHAGSSAVNGKTQVREYRIYEATRSFTMNHAVDQSEPITVTDSLGNTITVAGVSGKVITINTVSTPSYYSFIYWTQEYIWDYQIGNMAGEYHETNAVSESLGVATGINAHAENQGIAAGSDSHAQGRGTIALGPDQSVMGRYNSITYPSDSRYYTYAFQIGNGKSDTNRSDAMFVTWGGNATIAGTLSQSSDKRLKEHKSYLDDDAVEFIRKLKPAHYTKDGEEHVGFYAQEVQEADPWNCMTGEMNGYMTLGYTEIIAPLVRYCQELEERIKQLENK